MLSLRQLFESTRKLRSKVNPTNTFAVKEAVPIPLGNALAMRARFEPLTDGSMDFYNTHIVFHGLSFTLKKDDKHPLGIEVMKGTNVYMGRPSFSHTPVGVYCLCKDYYYVAWYWNMQAGSHSGPDLPAYVRKTPPPPLGYPYANSLKVPLACKHILRLAQHLSDRGLIVP